MNVRYFPTLIILLLTISCARTTTPEGGPKDLEPPKLQHSNPSNNQKNFKEKSQQKVKVNERLNNDERIRSELTRSLI